MAVKKRLFFLSLIGVLFFCMTSVSLADASPVEVKFPSAIKYKVLVGGKVVGSATLKFNRPVSGTTYDLHLIKFKGLGIQANQSLHTYVEKRDLSLYDTQLCEGKKNCNSVLYEIRILERTDIDMSKRQAYAYKERGSKGSIDTMLFSDYNVIDLLSAFLITSEKVRKGDKSSEKVNLFVDKSTRIVDMVSSGKKKVSYQGNWVETESVSLKYYGTEILKFNIFNDNGMYFPLSVTIDDETRGRIELRAARIRH